MTRVLFADDDLSVEDFAADFVPGFLVFEDDFAAAFLVLADEDFADDVFPAFLSLEGAFVFGGAEESVFIIDSSGSDFNAAFTLFDNAFFLASSVFGEDAFFTGEILITPICNF